MINESPLSPVLLTDNIRAAVKTIVSVLAPGKLVREHEEHRGAKALRRSRKEVSWSPAPTRLYRLEGM